MSSGNRGILQVFRRAARKAKNFRLFTKRSSFEGFFASKGAAYALPDGDFARRATKHGGEMQLHLQAMVNLLRDEDVLRLVVKLECQYPNRIRYLTIVSAFGPDEEEQSIIMGVDWTDKATIGLVVPLYRDTSIKLDGDGGFKMTSADRTNIFKPISVQTMWTALQWIHKCGENARRHNYFYPNGSSHAWVDYYYRKISSDRVCINEWEQMDDLFAKRPESPIGTSTEKELVMKLIRHRLKEVMARVDLEEVTCKQVRNMVEEDTQMELKEYRSFIDQEMITILGQMDSASKIFDHVYLGSEWNASNLEELKENGVGFILNITREIDNFFPGTFCYHNIRVYDVDETELLHHWDNTYKFIQRAKDAGSKCLVHCRMGVSRSASTVIAYGMKEYGWSLGDTMKFVKSKRSVVQPNAGFWKQLITYEGILNSSKNRFNRLFRHGSFSAEAEEESKSAGAAKKQRKDSPSSAGITDEQSELENVDTVDNLPTVDESNEESGVVQTTSETTDDVTPFEGASLETGNANSVPVTSSPIVPDTETTVETSIDALEESNSVQSTSLVSEIAAIEKSSLHRVSSVPALSSGDQKRQESDDESSGKFRRSYSLRERGSRKLQQLPTVTKLKSASDENLKEFERKKKEILCLEDQPEVKDSQDATNVEKESAVEGHSGLPTELHGVLESGFVKRHSRKFEEGVLNVPSVEDVLDDGDGLATREEMEVECAPEENVEIIEEEHADVSMPSEEPEPGVVKKHKEGYELKHRLSLKRRALLQRGESGERKSVKREGDEIEGVSSVDADSELMQTEGGLEGERMCGMNVEALVQRVNEDMKKEVSTRRISASKKEQELRAFVQKAGEQMREVLANGEDETSKEYNNCVADAVDSEEINDTRITKQTTHILEENVHELLSKDSQFTGTYPQRGEPVALKGDTKSATVNIELMKPCVAQNVSAGVECKEKSISEGETSELSGIGGDRESGQDTENAPKRGLVKRHTLLIEEKLQPLDQELKKESENEEGKEGEPIVDRKVSSPEGESRTAATDTEKVEITSGQSAIAGVEPVEKITPERAETSECSVDREDEGSEQDTENIPQKGLVKRHTLLIEGKLQPLDQEFEKNAEKENHGNETAPTVDQDACLSPLKIETSSAALDTEQPELSVAQSVNSAVVSTDRSVSERAETSQLPEACESRESEHDTENILQKGLVKRQTLLIEGKQQPLDEKYDNNAENENGKESEPTGDQEACSSPSKGEASVATDTEQAELNVTQGESDGVESTEINAAEIKGISALLKDREDRESEEDAENILQKGLVKRHTLLIEGRLQPLDQELDKETEEGDGKEGEPVLDDKEVCLSQAVDQGQLQCQIEQTSESTVEQGEEENQDNAERISGLVKREKFRIEERLQPAVVEPKGEQENDSAALEADGGVKEDSQDGEEIKEEEEQSEIVVDTSSVVRVKEQAQHLEGIIRVKQDGDTIKRETSKGDEPESKSSDEAPPKVVIIPRSPSDESMDKLHGASNVEKLSEDRMEVLSDSAVNIALIKAQENLDLEKENLELEKKNFVDWEVANVKQRTRIFEDIMRHFDTKSPKGDEESENNSNSLRRHESMPKMIRTSEKPALRRRSVSDVTKTVSSGSDRKVGYTIQFKDSVVGSASSSSLPRDWSPLQIRQRQQDKGEFRTKDVFSSEIYRQDELQGSVERVELVDRQDKENEAYLSVKETIQVLDSKNQRNISNIS